MPPAPLMRTLLPLAKPCAVTVITQGFARVAALITFPTASRATVPSAVYTP